MIKNIGNKTKNTNMIKTDQNKIKIGPWKKHEHGHTQNHEENIMKTKNIVTLTLGLWSKLKHVTRELSKESVPWIKTLSQNTKCERMQKIESQHSKLEIHFKIGPTLLRGFPLKELGISNYFITLEEGLGIKPCPNWTLFKPLNFFLIKHLMWSLFSHLEILNTSYS
jgi:hypothetical protein